MTEDIREKAGSFSCPSCGGRPTWNPARQNLHCPYCGSDIPVDMDRTAPAEYDIHTAPVGRAARSPASVQGDRAKSVAGS